MPSRAFLEARAPVFYLTIQGVVYSDIGTTAFRLPRLQQRPSRELLSHPAKQVVELAIEIEFEI